jgi:hypothetical protein
LEESESALKIAVELNQQSEIDLNSFKLQFDLAKVEINDNIEKFLIERLTCGIFKSLFV